jgi:[methyl-Co(III) methanol-specific corrinoid protein]:coenzyme M methyltransferase
LALLQGRRQPQGACFSGLISVTQPGLDSLGLHFSRAHADPASMAAAAASTYRLFGFESAVVPLDLCVEASALGAQIDYRQDAPRPEFPIVVQPLAAGAADFRVAALPEPKCQERLAVVLEAIRLLKAGVGQEVVVGAWVPGPLTLAMQVIALGPLTAAIARNPAEVGRVLDELTELLAIVASAYRTAGADFITIHEMGGSPGFVGPPAFKNLILPRLQRLIKALAPPRVLSVCGNTNRAMALLAECGADALSVDQTNDLARSRETVGSQATLFGNIDPIGTLANGDEAEVRRAVRRAVDGGADAVWPGCDLWPLVPAGNLRAMVDESRRYTRG